MQIRSVGFNSIYDADYRFHSEPESGSYMIVFFRSNAAAGEGDERRSIPAGTFMVFSDSIPRDYRADDGVLVCDWLCFESEGETEFIDSLELRTGVQLCYTDTEYLGSLMRNIAEEFYSMNSRRSNMLDTLLRMLLLKLSDRTERRGESIQQTSDPHYSSLLDLRAKIYRNPQQKWNVDTMAADVNMSRSYFQHVYREVFGVSCISDVISGKIEKAKEILSETDCTVSQVATMCGYDNEEHFMRQFKKIVGVTPTKYRKGL